MNKVKLPHKVALALEFLKNELGEEFMYKFENMITHYKKSNKYKNPTQSHINTIVNYAKNNPEHRQTYYAALVNGYERELSKEEQVLELYKRKISNMHLTLDRHTYELFVHQALAIEETLNLLNIEIDGINKK